jgi:hypothetical protein
MSQQLRNYQLYNVGDEVLTVRTSGESGPDVFTRAGETSNVRTLATADAVIYESQCLDVVVEDGWIILQDPWAGVQERLDPAEWLTPSVAMLESVEPLFAGGDEQR